MGSRTGHHRLRACRSARSGGFTLIELLVVMAALGLLLSIAAPRYIQHVDRAREVVLRHNLSATRTAIDKFFADHARYPVDLGELVQAHYLRELPVDPINDRADTWVLIAPEGKQTGEAVIDLHSGSTGTSREGTPYASW